MLGILAPLVPAKAMPCKHIKANGEPCRAPEHFVDASGYCHAHGEGASARMADRGRKGAEASAKRFRAIGLDPDDLPPLDGPRAASQWLEVIGRTVATGKLGHREAQAAVRAVEAWLKTNEAGAMSDELRELRSVLTELKRPKVVQCVPPASCGSCGLRSMR